MTETRNWPSDEDGNPTGLYFGEVPTSRGFEKLNFRDRYGVACSIQKSSLATDECIWFGADHIGLKEFVAYRQPNAWEDVELENTETHHFSANNRMHLNREQIRALLPILQRFVDTGALSPASGDGGGE